MVKVNFVSRAGFVRSTILVKDLKRGDQGSELSCTATNTNLTPPAETKIKIELMCKYCIL